jgi:hypothetical protein
VESPVAAPETKNVVIEEFTGVRCPNCPQGHAVVAALKSTYPGKIVAVSLHPINSLGAPYSFSPQNFENNKAQTLFDYLVQIGLEPAAAVNRKLFSGETNILLDKTKWTNYTAQEFAVSTPVNVLLSKTYDSTNHLLTVVAELHYTQNISEQNKLTILLTESNIVAPQLNNSVIDTFYVHKDVMLDFITDTQGDAIAAPLTAGRVVRKVYQKVLDAAWKPENMSIVAFVHEFQNSKVIYQGKETTVQ